MMTNARVLVVDDEATTRMLVRAALKMDGFDVSLASGGEDALRQFRSSQFDLILLDVEMPDLNGHRVCAMIRAEAGVALPIIMVTGRDDVASISEAFDAGATDFVVKPVNPTLLSHRVKYVLRANQSLLALRDADSRNAAVLSAVPDALIEMGLDGSVLAYHSTRSYPFAGERCEVVGKPIAELLSPDAAAVVRAALNEALRQGSSAGAQYEVEQPEGRRWLELSVARKNGEPGAPPRFIVLARDVSERKEADDRIARLAFVDSLTGLPNRHSFLTRVDREIARATQDGRKLAVLFMDLDAFKDVNDSLGHSAGDLILQWAADRLSEGLRPSDMVARSRAPEEETSQLARLGGDEFTALLLNIGGLDDALAAANRLGRLMRRPFVVEGRSVTLTTSVGVAMYPEDGQDAATLLKHADTAMYHAKASGRDNAQPYRVSLTERAVQRMELDASLRVALERNEFKLVYQPQFDIDADRITSVEALIRWNHPTRGLVSPVDFVPMAEENGLIAEIGRWVLRTACADAAEWARRGRPLGVAVNLSPLQFNNPGLVEQVRDVLIETELDPSLLELEITESALMENSEATMSTLRALQGCGVRIALDDFGTGYSSLGYLTRMPIGNVKIDRCFVTGLLESKENEVIVRAVVAMAQSLGLSVTAEGVETIEQAQRLKAMACQTLQGYYFSRPVPAEDLDALLVREWHLSSPALAVAVA